MQTANELLTQINGITILQHCDTYHKEHPYLPRLKDIFTDRNCEWTCEVNISDDHFNLRFFRIKNERRTHDMIINEFENNKVIFENEKSQSCELQFAGKQHLLDLFHNIPIYMKYKRTSRYPKYKVVKTSQTTVDHLLAILS